MFRHYFIFLLFYNGWLWTTLAIIVCCATIVQMLISFHRHCQWVLLWMLVNFIRPRSDVKQGLLRRGSRLILVHLLDFLTLRYLSWNVLHVQIEIIIANLIIIILFVFLWRHRFSNLRHESRRIDLLFNACIGFKFSSWADHLLLIFVSPLDRKDLGLRLGGWYLLLCGEALVVGEFLERVRNASTFLHVVLDTAHLLLVFMWLISLDMTRLKLRLMVSRRILRSVLFLTSERLASGVRIQGMPWDSSPTWQICQACLLCVDAGDQFARRRVGGFAAKGAWLPIISLRPALLRICLDPAVVTHATFLASWVDRTFLSHALN